MMAVVQVGEMKKQSHVECLADSTEPLHEQMIETREVTILQRGNNRTRQRDDALLDRVGRELGALQIHFRKNVERLFNMPAVAALKISLDERVVDFIERAGELLVCAASPLLASN